MYLCFVQVVSMTGLGAECVTSSILLSGDILAIVAACYDYHTLTIYLD